MARAGSLSKRFLPQAVRARCISALVLVLGLLLAGCGQAPILVRQWTLDYPPPAQADSPPLPMALGLARFSAAVLYQSQDMLYGPQEQRRQAYPYHRWRVSPSDLVGDILLRDLRASRRFAAVVSYRDGSRPRYRVEGGVERFYQAWEPGGGKAMVSLLVTLLDTKQKDVVKRILWQREYAESEPLAGDDPRQVAPAMSRALSRMSKRIIADLAQTLAQAKP